jgi:PAS domain S-box-containing protein
MAVNQKPKRKKIHLRSLASGKEHSVGKSKTPGRAQGEELLRAWEEKFRRLMEVLPEGILLLDADSGTITDANPAIQKMFGCAADELIAKKPWELEALKEVPTIQDAIQKCSEDKSFRDVLLIEARDGQRRRVELTATAYRAGSKDIIQCNFQDITDTQRAEETLARQGKELARLYRASVSPISKDPFDLQNLAQNVIRAVRRRRGPARCSIFQVQESSNELNRIAFAGPDGDRKSKSGLLLDGPGLVQEAIQRGRMIGTPDVRAIPDYVPDWAAARTELAFPLLVNGRVIGVLDVQCASYGAFNDDDVRLLSVFAERVTLALEHERLYTQAERRIQNLASLRMIDRAISSSFDLHFTLGVLLDQVTEQLGADAADVLLVSPATQTLRFTHGRGFRTQALYHIDLRMDESCAGRVVHERQVVTIPALNKNCDAMKRAALFQTEAFVTYMGAPLIAKGQVRGVLEIFQRKASALDQEQRVFLEMLAGQAAIAVDSAELFENLQNSNAELTMAYDETIEGWSHAMDLRDEETEGHTRRVTELTLQMASSMGFSIEELVDVRRGALLHDIGKIGVPDAILLKPGPLTDEEWETMRRHPQFAYDMLAPITYLRKAVDIPYCHHEKWDGTGYPRGLKGEQIPWAARIFAVADVWDALTSDRPYRKAWSKQEALAYIREQAGRYFDPQVVEIFLKNLPKDRRDIAPRRRRIKTPVVSRVAESP